jgi:CHAD domain-containing protein
MTKLSPELLDRQPEEVSRILALSLLEEAAHALERLGDPEDSEALHDFRVGVRRLRSSMRAYRPYLKGSIPKKLRKGLRALASSTNTARDAEVQLAWLTAQSDQLGARERIGLQWLIESLEADKREAHVEQLRRVAKDFGRLRKALTKRLTSWKVRLDLTANRPSASFKNVTGALMQEQLGTLSGQLKEIRSPEDNAQAHAARISAKRLRYLLEPLGRAVPGVKSLVKELKGLQDILGDLHDSNLLMVELGTAMEASAIERARRLHRLALEQSDAEAVIDAPPGNRAGPEEHSGLLALAKLLKERRQRLFEELESQWQGGRLEQFLARVEELGVRLGSTAHDRRARRFLLERVPDPVKTSPSTLIDEGWLPGDDIEELLRRVRSKEGVRYYRIIRHAGERSEERISRRTFASFWHLTENRRVRKRRYDVMDGDRKWVIDDFVGHELVLAEVDVLPEEDELPLPDWLVSCLQKEVTEETRYLRPYSISRKARPSRRPAADGATAPEPALSPDASPGSVSNNGDEGDRAQTAHGAKDS